MHCKNSKKLQFDPNFIEKVPYFTSNDDMSYWIEKFESQALYYYQYFTISVFELRDISVRLIHTIYSVHTGDNHCPSL